MTAEGSGDTILPITWANTKENPMPEQSQAVTFDVDSASLASLQEALPEWEIKEVNGITAAAPVGRVQRSISG